MFGLSGYTASNIDSPTSEQTYSGIVTISGWAVGNTLPIANVAVSVDGNFLGYANYGTSRPDVYANYAFSPSGANVGFNFSFDGNSLTNGSHTLSISATDGAGQTTTSSVGFNIVNSTFGNQSYAIPTTISTISVVPATTITPIPTVSSSSNVVPVTTSINNSEPVATSTNSTFSILPLILIGGIALVVLVTFGDNA